MIRNIKTRPTIIRFLEKIEVSETLFYNSSPCWIWHGSVTGSGYGELKIIASRQGTVKSSPHRFSFIYFIGAIGPELEVDHLCRNRLCASPLHLEAVSLQENRRRRSDAQTHCKNGHEFTPENTYAPSGRRSCRICLRENQRRFHHQTRSV